MSGTTLKRQDHFGLPESRERDLVIQLNAVMAALDGVLAKLDLDGGVTDTNYASLWGTGYSKIGNPAGTAITA